MGRAVGIELGTTNSCVAVLEGGEPTVIANAEGSRTTPSIVAFAKNGEVLVGEVAKRQAVTNPDRTIRSVKREMGTNWSLDIDGKKYTPQGISALILRKLKRDGEAYLGEAITDAVITVPAFFNDAQRTATKEAGEIAGFNVLRIVNEPTAAALAYGLDKGSAKRTALVFHLGGGTFDVSVLELAGGVVEIRATSGDNHLGGDDWDERIIEHLVKTFRGQYGIDLSRDKMAMQRLKEAAEKAKIELSAAQTTGINLPYITAGPDGPLHLDVTLTRAEFQRMTQDLVNRCRGPFGQATNDARVKPANVDNVILVGGSTRMPAVTDLVKQLTGKDPNKGVNPDEVVAVGAALQAGVLKGGVRLLVSRDDPLPAPAALPRAFTLPPQAGTRTSSHSVFIGYRRDDAAQAAHRIYDYLTARLGDDAVFIDLDRIPPGVDFERHIQSSIQDCRVFLAVIGRNWVTPRLHDPKDFVRIEIESAFRLNRLVVPVLVDDATMPRQTDLPPSLQDLCRRNAWTLHLNSFKPDCMKLVDHLAPILS